MADFMVKLSQNPSHPVESSREGWWTLHVDKASRASSSRVGLILQSPTRVLLKQAIWLSFFASNNEVEYEVVLARLDLVLALAITKLEICNDSQLIVRKIQKEYETKDERMAHYLTMVGDSLKKLDEWMIRQVPRKKNLKVNAMAGIVATLPIREVVMMPIYLQVSPSSTLEQVFNSVEANLSWMHDIVKYLRMEELLEDEKHAHKVCIQAARPP